MFEQIVSLDGGNFSEEMCAKVMVQIASAVQYMHSMGIVHRDLKPENILCVKKNSIQKIKIADFGLSKALYLNTENKKKQQGLTPDSCNEKRKNKKFQAPPPKPNNTMNTMCGTIAYAAPEILMQKNYKKSCDLFSIGVIMFILLCGYPPFEGETEMQVKLYIFNLYLTLSTWVFF